MSDHLVTVASYPSALEAQMARNLLEAEGIKAILTGELTADTFSGVSDPCRLQVHETDARRATAILATVNAETELEEDWEKQAESGVGFRPCPVCDTPINHRLAACPFCQAPNQTIRQAPGVHAARGEAPRPHETIQPRDRVTERPPPPRLSEEPSAPAPAKAPGCAVLFLALTIPPLCLWLC